MKAVTLKDLKIKSQTEWLKTIKELEKRAAIKRTLEDLIELHGRALVEDAIWELTNQWQAEEIIWEK